MSRRPIGPTAMDPAARKRAQRARDMIMVMEQDDSQWPARVCLLVLRSKGYTDNYKQAAWRQLGRINGWVE